MKEKDTQAWHEYKIIDDCPSGPFTLCESENIGGLSDGYHTFDELYAHRIALFMSLCFQIYQNNDHASVVPVWKSLTHSDGSEMEGWFVMGIYKEKGKQITYHLPIAMWKDCDFAETLENAPEYDGHSPADVLERLKKL